MSEEKITKVTKIKTELRPLLIELGTLGGVAGIVIDGPRFQRKAQLFQEIKNLYLQLSEVEQKELVESYGSRLTETMFQAILKFSDHMQEGAEKDKLLAAKAKE